MDTKTIAGILAGVSLVGGAIVYDKQGQQVIDNTVFQNVQGVDTAQKEFFNAHGKYLQVLPNSKLPSGAEAKTLLGKDLPAGAVIDEYVAPKGAGYQIRWSDENGDYSKGYGPEADGRTWVHLIATTSATST